MIINYTAISDTGLVRTENQDSILSRSGAGWGLFLVADGMGGHQKGAWASKMVADAYDRWIVENGAQIRMMSIPDIMQEIRFVLTAVNSTIRENTEAGQICGSTLVLLLVIPQAYIILSTGDSRCYEIKKSLFQRSLDLLTTDDTDEFTGKLTSAVGPDNFVRCSIFSGEIKGKAAFLLCSDGIYRYCEEKELASVIKVRTQEELDASCKRLKELVYSYGARDNLSAILITCH